MVIARNNTYGWTSSDGAFGSGGLRAWRGAADDAVDGGAAGAVFLGDVGQARVVVGIMIAAVDRFRTARGNFGADEDPLARNSEREESVGLDLDVLCVGRAAAVSDAERLTHVEKCSRQRGFTGTVHATPLRNTPELEGNSRIVVFRSSFGSRNTSGLPRGGKVGVKDVIRQPLMSYSLDSPPMPPAHAARRGGCPRWCSGVPRGHRREAPVGGRGRAARIRAVRQAWSSQSLMTRR